MDSKIFAVVGLAFIFVAGFGWGQWYAERSIRRERVTLERDRLVVSTPIDPGLAADVMETLSLLIRNADGDSKVQKGPMPLATE